MVCRLYDCFTFFDEFDLLEIRLAELSSVVDRFVLVEATTTFQGEPKPLHFAENKARFRDHLDKIEHVIVDMPEVPPRLSRKSRNKSNLDRARAWDREYYQRDQIARGLTGANPDDIVMVSDVDEIPRKSVLENLVRSDANSGKIIILYMPYYRFFLNCKVRTDGSGDVVEQVRTGTELRSVQPLEHGGQPFHGAWNGPHLIRKRHMTSPQRLRLVRDDSPGIWKKAGLERVGARIRNFRICGMPNPLLVIPDAGWHFSSLGGYEGWKKKVQAFSHVEYRFTTEFADRSAFDSWFNQHEIVALDELPFSVQSRQDALSHLLYRA
jgi:beta-1,4-mannosyl-glycoprotein beta-1,4-N-acetylglucosaminyltransferase